jgi:hypothetical protein
VLLKRLDQLKKSTSSGTRTGNFSAYSIVPQPSKLPLVRRQVGKYIWIESVSSLFENTAMMLTEELKQIKQHQSSWLHRVEAGIS